MKYKELDARQHEEKEEEQFISSRSGVTMKRIPTDLVSPYTPNSSSERKTTSNGAHQIKDIESPRSSLARSPRIDALAHKYERPDSDTSSRRLKVEESPRSPGRSPRIAMAARLFEQFHSKGNFPTSRDSVEENNEKKSSSAKTIPTSARSSLARPTTPNRSSVRLKPEDVDRISNEYKQPLVSPRQGKYNTVTPRTPKTPKDNVNAETNSQKNASVIESQPVITSKGSQIRRHGTVLGSTSSRSIPVPEEMSQNHIVHTNSKEQLREEPKKNKENKMKKKKKAKRLEKRPSSLAITDIGTFGEQSKSTRGDSRRGSQAVSSQTEKELDNTSSFLRHTSVVRTASGRNLPPEEKEKKRPGSIVRVFGSIRQKHKRNKDEKSNTMPEIGKKPSPRGK
jgi:hypothetical protein